MLKKFFTSRHPKVVHNNHTDILFNGHLYFYNEGKFNKHNPLESGKIEIHELTHLEN